MTEKYCPLKEVGYRIPCWEEDCAWWDEGGKRCVIVSMANNHIVTSSTVHLGTGSESQCQK